MHLIVNLSKIDCSLYQEENSSLPQTCSRNYFLVIKAAVTRWLSHGKAAQQVLDCYTSLIDAIYERQSDLVKHKVISSLCFLADILRVQMFCKLFYKERGLTFWRYPMYLFILFKWYNGRLSVQKSRKEVILVDYKRFLMLQYSLLRLVSTVSQSHKPRHDVESFKEKTIHSVHWSINLLKKHCPFFLPSPPHYDASLMTKSKRLLEFQSSWKVSHKLTLQLFQKKLKILSILVKKESYLLLIFTARK